MKILVARIPEEGSNYEGDDPGDILQVEGEQFIKNPGDVHYELYAQRVSDELVVRGALEVGLDLQCARCSQFFSTTVGVSDFLRAYPAPDGTDSVDITDDLREELLLHVPGFPVCNDECKGVCPRCGADLNKGSCECEDEERPSAWSALDGLNL
ncbi:hypothetical protein PDESU_00176 [Pontiella desulfatans]|uniref:Large ribosomal RNA subunit accumulation protein YceD n=1 Tax=Pontiella desulfatans TaxID=2750659 RepID=A0A6C2TWC6_PONDE|nr:DUF177 domain-containing protein [Pontiella desulfatans]VGO11631.1 hypothetical protein PDESU_00176 [Pontiella desulfatans]